MYSYPEKSSLLTIRIFRAHERTISNYEQMKADTTNRVKEATFGENKGLVFKENESATSFDVLGKDWLIRASALHTVSAVDREKLFASLKLGTGKK